MELDWCMVADIGTTKDRDVIYGTVNFHFSDDDLEVGHSVKVRTRVKASPSQSLEDIEKVLLASGADVLSRSMAVLHGATPQSLHEMMKQRDAQKEAQRQADMEAALKQAF